jgi:hypothetical protein
MGKRGGEQMDLLELLDQIESAVGQIREATEYPMLRETYFESRVDEYNKFCVALDTLEDSVLAIRDYCQAGFGDREGENYLRLYGLFQAVFLQQDSIRSLWEVAFEGEFPAPATNSAWKIIREIRNDATGHPIEVTRNTEIRRTFVSRAHLERGKLFLVTYERNSNQDRQQEYNPDELLLSYFLESIPSLLKLAGKVRNRFPLPAD